MSFPSRLRLVLIVLAVFLAVGIALSLGLRKTATITVNGSSHTFTTYAFTVGSLLHAEHIPLSPQDDLSPAQDTWLKNGAEINILRAIPVQIFKNGKLTSMVTTGRSVPDLINQAGYSLSKDDRVLTNGQQLELDHTFPAALSSISLQILPSVSFTLTVDGQQSIITSTEQTLGSALWAAGYELFNADQLTPPADTPLTPGLTARLQRSRMLTIKTMDGDVVTRTAVKTVGQALLDTELSLQGLDYSIPDAGEPIPSSGVIQLVRVLEKVLVEQTPLPFDTQFQPVDSLDLDSQSIVQPGEYGLNAKRIRIRYEDGQEVSQQTENEWVARQPVPRIIGYGTLITMHTDVVDGISIQYWRKLDMYATSYHPSEGGGTTASGLPLKKGVAAIDRRYVPFFTQMYVPGYGEALAADTGGGVIGRWIDLGYSDEDYVPWHQWVTVYFLWPPPDNIVWIIP